MEKKNMKNPFIVGEKVFLRAVEREDAELLMQCNNHPEVRYPFFIAFPVNIYQTSKEIEKLYESREYIPFIICEKTTGRGVGITAFHRVDLVSRAAIYSIRIADSADWGRGFGSEVNRLMIEYGFEQLNLNRIQLHVYEGNSRALKSYEKAGFVKEGLLRQAMYHNDEYCNFHVMGLLREEYYSKKTESNP